ncbi:MAG: YceD family protein [Ilumatobacteraceae bacterium]
MTGSAPTRALRINTSELRRQPGTRRQVEVSIAPGDLGIDDDRITADVDVAIDLESTTDGIVAGGTVRAGWADSCRRCLRPIEGVAVAHVDELYQEHVTDADAFPIEGDQLDLAPMVRELVLLELPQAPLCRDDCAGICPVCGRDRNVDPCACDQVVRDERWAVLDDLDLE